jgi:hypothetical protein
VIKVSILIGNPSAWVGLTIELRAIGPVPVIVGQGILLLVGEADRGPSSEAIVMNSRSNAATYFHSGDLKDAIELAFGNGCPVVFAIRVLGAGAAKAHAHLSDSMAVPEVVLTVTAASEGDWGNNVVLTVETGDYDHSEYLVIPGDGGTDAYYLVNADLVSSSNNYVRYTTTAGVLMDYSGTDIEYGTTDSTPSGTGKIYVNTRKGSFVFFSNEWPTAVEQITYNFKYHTKKVTITDNERTMILGRSIPSLVHLIADLSYSGLAVGTAAAGKTHLPANGTYVLADGDDGDPITLEDWEAAMETGGEYAAELVGGPTCVALTANAVGLDSLIPSLDAFLTDMSNKFHPCLGFVTMDPNSLIADALNTVAGYNNRLLSVVINGWDNSTTPRNIAIARAAKECAVPLGESAAMASNAMNGLNGLLNSFNQSEQDILTTGGVDVIIKKRGILPYIGISTATDWQFMRCVDNRTINFVIIACEYICRQYYHQKRTPRVLSSIKRSIAQMLEDLIEAENIRAFSVSVSPHPTDTGRVNIDLTMENIGHIERFHEVLGVGIMEDLVTNYPSATPTTGVL